MFYTVTLSTYKLFICFQFVFLSNTLITIASYYLTIPLKWQLACTDGHFLFICYHLASYLQVEHILHTITVFSRLNDS